MSISFLPGPSEITEKTLANLQEIARSGLLSESHRSPVFKQICMSAVQGIQRNMRIPGDYRVVFTSSATAAMSVCLRSLVRRCSHHFVHGAFGARFHSMALRLGLTARVTDGDPAQALDWQSAELSPGCELMALTHNETSMGSMWPHAEMAHLRARYPDPLLVIDVTSSFGAMTMDWSMADLWFCSVQKCLGLPAGLGILVVGPRALAVAGHLLELDLPHRPGPQESLSEMSQRMEEGQTFETPNVLAIALLARQMEVWDLDRIEEAIREKASMLDRLAPGAVPYMEDPAWQSLTVQNLRCSDPERLRERAAAKGFLIGKGYGTQARSCVRIANFPATTCHQYEALLETLGAG